MNNLKYKEIKERLAETYKIPVDEVGDVTYEETEEQEQE